MKYVFLTYSDSIGPLYMIRHQNLSVYSIHPGFLNFGPISPVGPVHKPVGRYIDNLDTNKYSSVCGIFNVTAIFQKQATIWLINPNICFIFLISRWHCFTTKTGLRDRKTNSVQKQQVMDTWTVSKCVCLRETRKTWLHSHAYHASQALSSCEKISLGSSKLQRPKKKVV